MTPFFSTQAKEDIEYWTQHNKKKLARINELITDIERSPYSGIGKPEPLRFEQAGYWSRRIDQEHRLVYKVVDGQIYIAQGRYHYGK